MCSLDVKMICVSVLLIVMSVAGLGCKTDPLQIPVSRMVEQEVVPYEYIGIGGWQGKNHRNFLLLKEEEDTNALLRLLDHESPVVSCYAGWTLVDKNYSELTKVFDYYLNNDRSVPLLIGCLTIESSLSIAFYHRLWNAVEDKSNDDRLIALDYQILARERPDWQLLSRALGNRKYPLSFKERIADLAFDYGYLDAVCYLGKWYPNEYEYQEIDCKHPDGFPFY